MKNSTIYYSVLLAVASCFMVHVVQAKPKVPSTSQSYTVQQLVTLINTSNPSKTSKFLVLVDRSGKYASALGAAAGSASAERAKAADGTKLQGIIQSNLGTTVTLSQDAALINQLLSQKRLDGANTEKYKRILLYFELDGYRFYLNDPFPGKIVRMKGKRRSPADNIIKKWDFTP